MPTDCDAYAPFDSGAGAGNMESRWRDIWQYLFGISAGRNGILRGVNNQLEVFGDSSGLWVKVKTGQGFIQGHWGTVTAEKTVPVSANATGAVRVDRVVMRANYVTNKVELECVAGTSSTTPDPRTQNSNGYEISLGVVSVPNNASTIAAGDVVDARDFRDVPDIGAWAASEITVNNSTNLVDTGISIIGSSLARYQLESFIEYSAANTADLKTRLIVPTGGSARVIDLALDAATVTSGSTGDVDTGSSAGNADMIGAGTGVGTRIVAQYTGWIQMPESAASMVVKLQVAQNAAVASDLKVYSNSWMRLTRPL